MDNEDKIVEIINVFHIYYKKIFNISNSDNMFTNIDINDPKATNKPLEFLYEHMHKYKLIKEKNTEILFDENGNFNLDNYTEFYSLLINYEIVKLSESLYALLEYLINNYNNWYDIKWDVVRIDHSK
jgi:hypothetical protein